MRFSVLLPTHNRLEYLRHAVESVRLQDWQDWEIIVSDNASTDDIAGYVDELGDARVRYVRSDEFIPVTDNWNLALRHSQGDYVIMLGDDDALLQGYLSALAALTDRFGEPWSVYVGALVFAYPGVLPSAPDGYLKPKMTAPFFSGAEEPFRLDPEQARGLARDAAHFRARYEFNMQYVAVSRRCVQELSGDGDFYRSPFPDFYAMNLIFYRAPSIVVDPEPRVVIGITPKSHGFYYYNHREAEARAMLNSDSVDDEIRRDLARTLLPGTNMNTSWLVALECLYRRLGRPDDMRPDYARYRRLQVLFCEQAYHLHRAIERSELAEAERALTPVGRAVSAALGPPVGAAVRATPQRLRNMLGAVYDRAVGQFGGASARADANAGRYADMSDVVDQVLPRPRIAARAS
jgi:glycosyltransferase involved in cell wall biosynthesis